MWDADGTGAATVAGQTAMAWQHSATQIAMDGQFFPASDLSWWQGISSIAADAESIAMSDDIACASATAIVPAANTASGEQMRAPIKRTATARMKRSRSVTQP
jgi:hypothetical protein